MMDVKTHVLRIFARHIRRKKKYNRKFGEGKATALYFRRACISTYSSPAGIRPYLLLLHQGEWLDPSL